MTLVAESFHSATFFSLDILLQCLYFIQTIGIETLQTIRGIGISAYNY